MSLSHIMSFGQGKVTNKQAGACPSVGLFYSRHDPQSRGLCRRLSIRGRLAGSLRIHRYELDQHNCCDKNMLPSPNPRLYPENGKY
jgi:hypothetical protein